jgi:hypothetical protein
MTERVQHIRSAKAFRRCLQGSLASDGDPGPTSFHSVGSIRRECMDHLIVFNAEHLQRIVAGYAAYYNEMRTYVSLGKDAPVTRPVERRGDIVAYPVLGGLHHRYARIQFSEATSGIPPSRSDGYHGGHHCPAFALAESLRRAFDRSDPL